MPHSPRVLLMPSPVSSGSVGTVTKMLGIARALQARHCQVKMVMGGEVCRLITRNGFAVAPFPVPEPTAVTQPIRNMVDVINWTGLADADFVATAVGAEMAAIDEFRPDVVVAEARPTAAISSAAAKVPLVTIASWPMHPYFPANQMPAEQPLAAFNQQLKRFKLPEIDNVAELLFLRSDVKISPSLPELEPELAALPDIHFVGYMLDLNWDDSQLPAWYAAWAQEPLIFIYLSVGALAPDLYLRTIPEAFADLPYQVLCATGFHFTLKTETLPQTVKNVRFVRFIPAQAVMKQASLIIFHGGQDTMLMTLLHGLPSMTVPGQHFERQYNAQQMARLGVSKMLPVHAFRPHRLHQTVAELFTGSYVNQSREMAQRLRTYGGTKQGVDIILSLTGRKEVVESK